MNALKFIFAAALGPLFVVLCLAAAIPAQDKNSWPVIPPDELAQKASVVDPGASSEILLLESRVDAEDLTKQVTTHYVRAKIFNDAGLTRWRTVDIAYTKGVRKISDIAARVTNPDGTVTIVDPKEILEREIARAGGLKVKARSFALPNLQVGSILEYRYTERQQFDLYNPFAILLKVVGQSIELNYDVPVRRLDRYYRPLDMLSGNVVARFVNMDRQTITLPIVEKGYSLLRLDNIAAFKSEPYMPPEGEVAQKVIMSPTFKSKKKKDDDKAPPPPAEQDPDSDWKSYIMRFSRTLSTVTFDEPEIKAKSAEIIGGTTDPVEKLHKLFDFTRQNIRNTGIAYPEDVNNSDDDDDDDKADAKKEDKPKQKRSSNGMFSPASILAAGKGRGLQIDLLFAALAKSAGFDVMMLVVPDFEHPFFDPSKPSNGGDLQFGGLAVKVGESFVMLDPCSPSTPYGRVYWRSEGTNALMLSSTGYVQLKLPMNAPQSNSVVRRATFVLSPAGDIEGDVIEERRGSEAMYARAMRWDRTVEKRAEEVKDLVAKQFSQPEITGLTIENFTDTSKPLIYKYHLKVKSYASAAGKRLIMQPGVFQAASTPVFSATERKMDLYFPSAASEADLISIKLPPGMTYETGSYPQSVNAPDNFFKMSGSVKFDAATGTLKYERAMLFGDGKRNHFPSSDYQKFKSVTDQIHTASTRSVIFAPATK